MKKYIVLALLVTGGLQAKSVDVAATFDLGEQIKLAQQKIEQRLPLQQKEALKQEGKSEESLSKELEKALNLSRTQKFALKAFQKAFDQFIKYIGKDKAKELKKQVVAFVLNKLTLAAEGYVVLPKQEHMDLAKQFIQILKDEGVFEKAKDKTKEQLIKFLQKLKEEQLLTAEGVTTTEGTSL